MDERKESASEPECVLTTGCRMDDDRCKKFGMCVHGETTKYPGEPKRTLSRADAGQPASGRRELVGRLKGYAADLRNPGFVRGNRAMKRAPTRKGWAAIYDGEIDLATIRETLGEVKEAQRYVIVHDRFTRIEVRELKPRKRKGGK